MVTRPARRLPVVLAVVGLLVFGTVAARLHANHGVTGDEPHYLVMTYSLIKDGDFDVKNDYALQRYHSYYPGNLDPGFRVNPDLFKPTSPHIYLVDGVGLPALIAPFVAVAGPRGASAVLIAVALLVLLLVWRWTLLVTHDERAALFATLVVFVSVGFIGLAGYIFPDMILAALLLGGLILAEGPEPTPRSALLLGALAAMSFWFHLKFAAPFGLLVSIAAIRWWTQLRADPHRYTRLFVPLAAPIAVSASVYLVVNHAWFGVWNPLRIYPHFISIFAIDPLVSIPAMAIDKTKGLLATSPIFLLVALGLPLWAKAAKPQLIRVALVLVPSFVLLATFVDWWGGFAPAGRYPMEFMPALAPAAGLALARLRSPVLRGAAILLAVYQVALTTLTLAWNTGWVDLGERTLVFTRIQKATGIPLDAPLPSFASTLLPHFRTYLVHGNLLKAIAAGAIAVAVLGVGMVAAREVPGADPDAR